MRGCSGRGIFQYNANGSSSFVFVLWSDARPIDDHDMDSIPNTWEELYGLDLKIIGTPSRDPDADGMSNLAEYLSDTNPKDADSFLHIANVAQSDQNVSVQWVGGVESTQYLERNMGLTDSWSTIFINAPPTSITDWYEDVPGSGGFYRIRATR